MPLLLPLRPRLTPKANAPPSPSTPSSLSSLSASSSPCRCKGAISSSTISKARCSDFLSYPLTATLKKGAFHVNCSRPSSHPPSFRHCQLTISGRKGSSIRRATSHGEGNMGSTGNPMTFLSLEEAGLIEMSNLDMHERFLARLTVSSLNLLRVISEQENVPISDLNAGRICDWFVKDKEKRKDSTNSAVLKWDDGHGPGW